MTVVTTHTAGPWELSPIEDRDGGFAISADRYRVATAHMRGDGYKQQLANARLIAAAPELLAACVEAYDWIATHGDSLPPSAVKLSVVLRAAIAKAEGR
jgi:hypothetical protein